MSMPRVMIAPIPNQSSTCILKTYKILTSHTHFWYPIPHFDITLLILTTYQSLILSSLYPFLTSHTEFYWSPLRTALPQPVHVSCASDWSNGTTYNNITHGKVESQAKTASASSHSQLSSSQSEPGVKDWQLLCGRYERPHPLSLHPPDTMICQLDKQRKRESMLRSLILADEH